MVQDVGVPSCTSTNSKNADIAVPGTILPPAIILQILASLEYLQDRKVVCVEGTRRALSAQDALC